MTQIAYLDCSSGISGDMMLAALLDLGAELNAIQTALDSFHLPGLKLQTEEVTRCGFRAQRAIVSCQPEHKHRRWRDIQAMLDASALTARQKSLAQRIFAALAKAEARVHGVAPDEVVFHEVGAADSIADIVGVAVGWDLLGIKRATASPVAVGSGRIKFAHGECNVPAPATAELLRGVPLAESAATGELTTPTGAAILSVLADTFGPLPAMKISRIGCGAGREDFAGRPNILRVMLGETEEPAAAQTDQVYLLETNLDDCTGELIGHCMARLWEAGALDVYTTAIGMKKNRPGVKLSLLCRTEDVLRMEDILFRETGTLGVRRFSATRHILAREFIQVLTPWGILAGKLVRLSTGEKRFSPEYESCRQIAQERHLPLRIVYEAAEQAFRAGKIVENETV